MELTTLFIDKALKPKEKTEQLCTALGKRELTVSELIVFAKAAKDPVKASCIEAIEWVTREQPAMVDTACFEFIKASLSSKTPRVKWESARALANCVKQFPDQLEAVVVLLLENAEHTGTVVRWSAAQALVEMLKLKTALNNELLPAIEQLVLKEEKNSIRKLYLAGMKLATK